MQTNKQAKSVAFKTMSMKSRLANQIRMELYPFSDEQFQIKYKGKKPITNQDKIDFFDKIYPIYKEMDNELRVYRAKRKQKALIQKLREERKLQKQAA